MAKPKKIYIDGKDYFFWDYEEQTKMKHTVVSNYYKVWATKLGQYKPAYFFDCFGGCGAYIDSSNGSYHYGSPFLISEIASELHDIHNRNLEVWVTEPKRDNYENLLKVSADIASKQSVVPHIGKMRFEEFITHPWTIKQYRDDNTPVLFFLDPFGFSLNFEDIREIMNFGRNEMIINFMYDYISRFIGTDSEGLDCTYDKFFGTDEWREAIPLTGEEREKKLVGVYKEQLKKNAKYVFPYKLSFPDKDRTYYYLFHVTNNIDGCSKMKSIFASSNLGRVEYLGRKGNAFSLFDLEDMKVEDVKAFLVANYSGKKISFETILKENIDDTLYTEKELRAAIKELKQDGKATTIPVTSKTNRGVSGADLVIIN